MEELVSTGFFGVGAALPTIWYWWILTCVDGSLTDFAVAVTCELGSQFIDLPLEEANATRLPTVSPRGGRLSAIVRYRSYPSRFVGIGVHNHRHGRARAGEGHCRSRAL